MKIGIVSNGWPMPTPKPLRIHPERKSMIKNFIIDLDGVIYVEDNPTQGAVEFINFLRKKNLKFLFLTNNSTKTQRQYVRKLKKMRLDVHKENILTSSVATCVFLAKEKPDARIHAIGEHGLKSDLRSHGFILADKNVDFVVVGLDRRFNYEKLSRACSLIRGGALFIATNPDLTFPSKEGIIPGAGTLAATIEACTSCHPIVIGKPNPVVVDIAMKMMGVRREETAIIGDRFDTDIAVAKKLGMNSILVLSGIETPATVKASHIQPDYIFKSLHELCVKWPF
jgi:HAD superfamily hydrolase (TIGR01457 family)